MNTIIEQLNVQPEEIFFWGTHGTAELDLFIVRGNNRLGFEIKRTTQPAITSSYRLQSKRLN